VDKLDKFMRSEVIKEHPNGNLGHGANGRTSGGKHMDNGGYMTPTSTPGSTHPGASGLMMTSPASRGGTNPIGTPAFHRENSTDSTGKGSFSSDKDIVVCNGGGGGGGGRVRD